MQTDTLSLGKRNYPYIKSIYIGKCECALKHAPFAFFILLPAGTSIVLPVGEVMWQAEEEVYSDNLLRRLSE